MSGETVEVRCLCCGERMTVRVADRKRGWGKFCDKSCKAYYQSYGPKHRSVVPEPVKMPDPQHKQKRPRPVKIETPKPDGFGGWS